MSENGTQSRLVYVCEGGDCSEKGSVELHNDLREMLKAADPAGKNKLRKYPCFGGCEHGINITCFPDRVFLSKMAKGDLPALCKFLTGAGPLPEGHSGIVAKD